MLSRLPLRTSPWGILLAGVAVGVAVSPGLRKGLRLLTVKAVGAVLSVTDAAKSCSEKLGEGVSGIVTEAREQQEEPQEQSNAEALKSRVHAAGVAVVGGSLAVADRVKGVSAGAKQKWDGLVSEAKEATNKKVETVAMTTVVDEMKAVDETVAGKEEIVEDNPVKEV